MTTKKKRVRVKYTEEFKQQVVEDVLSGRHNVVDARLHYKIRGTNTVSGWVKAHKAKYGILAWNKSSMKKDTKNQDKDELLAELEAVKRLLESERKRSEAYLTMIKIAERQFNIPIEKKSGAKPSKK